MKKIIPFLLIAFFFSCVSGPVTRTVPTIHKSVFSNENELPGHLIIDDTLFEQEKKVILILKDYMKSYSKIVLYDTLSQTIVEDIYEPASGVISDYAYDQGILAFSVYDKGEDGSYHDLYYYDLGTKKIAELETLINVKGGGYPISLSTSEKKIAWVSHDFTKEESSIKVYDTQDGVTKSILTSSFNDSGLRVPFFFCSINQGKLLHDQIISDSLFIKIYDLEEDKEIHKLSSIEGGRLNYSGCLDWDQQYITLYAKTNQGDEVYRMDLNTTKITKLFGFQSYSYLKNDFLFLSDNMLHYIVQLDVSGMISDHHYYETYDLEQYTMRQERAVFDIFKSPKYTGLLTFEDAIESIGLEIF